MNQIDYVTIFVNLIYTTVGGFMGIGLMAMGFILLDRLSPIDTQEELRKNNLSIAIVVAAIFVGIGICSGLTMGLGMH